MLRLVLAFALPLVLPLALLPSPAAAQQGPPAPAAELKRFEPMVGTWTGGGTMTPPGGRPAQWKARGTFRWALDGHFLQWDFASGFEGVPMPLVFRSYLGWDRENKRFVDAMVNNFGEAKLHEMKVLADGSLLHVMPRQAAGVSYAERWLLKVDGDTMTYSVDILPAQGAATTYVQGSLKRGGDAFDGQFDAPPWMGTKAHESIGRLARSVGSYDVKGEMMMAPGQPLMHVSGVDTFRSVYGGTVLHGHTEGAAEGLPGKYVGEVFWGHDAAQNRMTAVYVSNFGEVMAMDAWWSGDGKLISTSTGLTMGQPSVQRSIMEFDAAGAATKATSHTILGDQAPWESFSGTYTKKK